MKKYEVLYEDTTKQIDVDVFEERTEIIECENKSDIYDLIDEWKYILSIKEIHM